MLGWILDNFAIFLTLIVIIIAVIVVLVLLFRKTPTVTKLEEKKPDKPAEAPKQPPEQEVPEQPEEKPEIPAEMSEEEETDARKKKVDYDSIDKKVSEVSEQEKQKKKKLFARRKKEVTRVFEPKKTEPVVTEAPVAEVSEEEFLKSRQFVKSGKRVSKLTSVSSEVQPEQVENPEQPAPEAEAVEVVAEAPAEKPSRIRKREGYFDHSKRLKDTIKNNSFDDMFASHITGDYLTIESDRHLSEGKYSEDLYKRTSEMLANSSVKVLISGEQENKPVNLQKLPSSTSIKNDKDYMRDWLDQKRHEELFKIMNNTDSATEEPEDTFEEDEDDVNLDSKNLLVVSSVMKRKKFKKQKNAK